MQAILTKHLGPTDFRGARVKAWCEAGEITLSWDHALNVDENHTAAAIVLRDSVGWNDRTMYRGGLPDKGTPNAYAFVFDYASERIEGATS